MRTSKVGPTFEILPGYSGTKVAWQRPGTISHVAAFVSSTQCGTC